MKNVTALGIVCNLMKHMHTKTLIVRNGKPKQYLSHERDLLDSLYMVGFCKKQSLVYIPSVETCSSIIEYSVR